SPLLRKQINIEQQHEGDQSEEQLRQVCLLNSNRALRPDEIRQYQSQQPGGQHQHDEDADRPELQIPSGELLNLLLNILRTRQHRRLNGSFLFGLSQSPSGNRRAKKHTPSPVLERLCIRFSPTGEQKMSAKLLRRVTFVMQKWEELIFRSS